MTEIGEQELAALLRRLRPAPPAWIAAAREIPRTARELERRPEDRLKEDAGSSRSSAVARNWGVRPPAP